MKDLTSFGTILWRVTTAESCSAARITEVVVANMPSFDRTSMEPVNGRFSAIRRYPTLFDVELSAGK